MSLPLGLTCATSAMLAGGPSVSLQAPPLPPPTGELAEREALDGVVDSASSEHFVYKWGADFTPTPEQIDTVLDGLEAAWVEQFEVIGFQPPPGSDVVKLNVYQSRSGVFWNGQEMGDVGGAFTAVDPGGWPMIGIDLGIWDSDAYVVGLGYTEPGELVAVSLAHELQHASHLASNAYSAQEHLWFREGLCEWSARRMMPGTYLTDSKVVALAWAPQMAWQWFDEELYNGWSRFDPLDPPDTLIYRVYGTWVLIEHIHDELGVEAVVEVAEGNAVQTPPVEFVDSLLADEGVELIDALAATWGKARTNGFDDATWMQATFEAVLAESEVDPDYEPLAGVLALDASMAEPPEHLAPGRYGMNRWQLPEPPAEVVVDLQGDGVGSEGTSTDWRVVAIYDRPDDTPDDWAFVELGVPLSVPADATFLELFVVTGGDRFVEGETFDYGVAVRTPAGVPSGGEEPGGCCSTAPGPYGAPLLGLLVPLVASRRRPTARPRSAGRR